MDVDQDKLTKLRNDANTHISYVKSVSISTYEMALGLFLVDIYDEKEVKSFLSNTSDVRSRIQFLLDQSIAFCRELEANIRLNEYGTDADTVCLLEDIIRRLSISVNVLERMVLILDDAHDYILNKIKGESGGK